jgi:hypothetical protein
MRPAASTAGSSVPSLSRLRAWNTEYAMTSPGHETKAIA